MVAVTDDELERFCREQWPLLVRAMWLHCGEVSVAEDVAQGALVRTWERWPEVRIMDRPDRWVMRVAFNLATSWFRRRSIEAKVRRLTEPREAAADASGAIEMRLVVLGLPPRQRAAVLLRHELGYSVREAAEILGCAEGTVKALTHQGLERLRLDLAQGEKEAVHD